MKLIRQLHLYFGMFFAPTIIFFAFTGCLQTFSLHEEHDGVEAQPWITELSEVHKDQRVPYAPMPRPQAAPPEAASPSQPSQAAASNEKTATIAQGEKPAASSTPSAPRPKRSKKREPSFPFKYFVLFMGVGLILSTLAGIYMSFKLGRSPALVLGLLIVGTILPIVLLRFG